MKGALLIQVIDTYPDDAEWCLFDEMGPNVEWTDPACGCEIAWSFFDTDNDILPMRTRCTDQCIKDTEYGNSCLRCAHSCQPFRDATEDEVSQYGA